MILVLLSLRVIIEFLPDIVIHENVIGFPMHVLTLFLADKFNLIAYQIDPRDFGFPVGRPRRYTILTKKYHTMGVVHHAELMGLLRSKSPCQLTANDIVTGEVEAKPLSPAMLRSKERYDELYPDALVVDLSQNADRHKRTSLQDDSMMTLTRGCSVLYSRIAERFFHPLELMLAQGIPVAPWASDIYQIPMRTFDQTPKTEVSNHDNQGLRVFV